MKIQIRGKEIYIVTGVILVVVIVAWWFLFYGPERSDVKAYDEQIQTAQSTLASAKQDVLRLEGYKKTAPQTQADLLRLNKMMPAESGIPSVIVELTSTASQSGLDFVRIEPGEVTAGQTFGVEPITLNFTGLYYDLEDFLFRLESYVEYRNSSFLVTGRLLQVARIDIGEGPGDGFPNLDIAITLNAYLWSPVQAATTAPSTAQQAALPAATASPTASPSASASESPTPTGSGQ